jgi:AcrR family transcriptional regulator
VGRPSQRLLSREQIARSALELLDADGPAGLAMRGLAQRLGVRAPSLYNHVAGQDEVVDLVHDLVDAEIDVTLLDHPDWRHGVEAFARSYRDAYLRHPNAVPLVVRRPVSSPVALGVYEALAAALLRAGVPAQEVLQVSGALDCIVLGSAVETFIDGFPGGPADYRATSPALAAALEVTDRAVVDDAAFDLALGLLLDGLAARIGTTAAPDARTGGLPEGPSPT